LDVKSYENNIDLWIENVSRPERKELVLGNPKKRMKEKNKINLTKRSP